jgi:pyridoxal/pyridoxine/pyridoxamine kinase
MFPFSLGLFMILSLLPMNLRSGLKYVCDPVMGDIGPGFYVPKVCVVAMHVLTYNSKEKNIAEISSIATINASGKS